MKQDERAYVKWLYGVAKRYQPILALDRYSISFEKNNDHYMACGFRGPYLDIPIYYSSDSLAAWKKDQKSEYPKVVHELCHIVTDRFYGTANNRYSTKDEIEFEREQLTDHIATIVSRLV